MTLTIRSPLHTVAGWKATTYRNSLSFDFVSSDSPLQQGNLFHATSEDHIVLAAYDKEVSLARLALLCHNFDVCFAHLERAHVLAQRSTWKHSYVHWLMLVAGQRRRDYREVVGQVPRIFASVLFSRLWVPHGNTGRARISAFKPMPVPEDLRHLVT